MFGKQHRLEAALAVPRRLDPHRAIPRQHRLARAPVAMVGHRFGLVRPRRIAKVMAQLRVQRRLNQRLLQRDAGRLNRLRRHRAGQKLRYQLLRDRRQLGNNTINSLRSARHNTLLRAGYASHTDSRTGSQSEIYKTLIQESLAELAAGPASPRSVARATKITPASEVSTSPARAGAVGM